MKKILAGISLAAVFLGVVCVTSPGVLAAEGDDVDTGVVTQAELARMLVRVMGLERYLAPGASDNRYFEILQQNGIYPNTEWAPDAPVEKGLLARLMVMSLRMSDRVEDINDYEACIVALREANIPIDTVGMALANVRGYERFNHRTPNVVNAQVDPIVRREPMSFNPLDEMTGAADAAGKWGPMRISPVTVKELIPIIAALPIASKPAKKPSKPVTPTNVG